MKDEFIYKYCTAKAAADIIKYNSFLMKNPADFNDPFECCPRALHPVFDIHRDDLIKKEHLMKYYNEATQEGFNGSFDDYVDYLEEQGIIDNIYREVKLNKRRVSNLAFELATGYSKEVRMTCFSKNPNSVLMWAHYADKQKGCILAFNKNHSDIRNKLYNVKYVKERPAIEFNDEQQLVEDSQKLLYTKSSIWKYEKEVRIIIPEDECEITKNNSKCLYFDPFMLCGIAYGARITKEDENEIDQAIQSQNIEDYIHRAITVLHPFKYEIQMFGEPETDSPYVWPVQDKNYE